MDEKSKVRLINCWLGNPSPHLHCIIWPGVVWYLLVVHTFQYEIHVHMHMALCGYCLKELLLASSAMETDKLTTPY